MGKWLQQIFNGKLRDEYLNQEIFYILKEAQVVIEQWVTPTIVLAVKGEKTRTVRSLVKATHWSYTASSSIFFIDILSNPIAIYVLIMVAIF